MVGLGSWIAIGWLSVAGVAEPPYDVLSEQDGYEIRQYAPQLVAEVEVTGNFTEATNRGFRALADYIFGNNTAPTGDAPEASESIAMTAPVIERQATSEAIAMTAPVIEASEAEGRHVVTFVMPEKYTLETLPKPKSPDVRIVAVPARICAVLRFSGNVGPKKAEERKQELIGYLERDGRAYAGLPMLAQYNPPWTPPFMRRNEVLVELKDDGAVSKDN